MGFRADKLCTFFNKAWLVFRGRTVEQELGNGWAEGVHPDDLASCMDTYSSSFDARGSFQMEYRLRRSDGEYRWVLDNGVPRFDPGGLFSGYIGSCIDITDLKRSQEVALTRQKMESLGVLAAGIAHDFNNLLGGILASAEAALADRGDGSVVDDELRRIRTASMRGGEIVRQLMIYGGSENPAFEPVDVSLLVGELMELLKASVSKNAVLKADLGKNLPAVLGSPAQIRQVVMNLVINASEALGDVQGEIAITVTVTPAGIGSGDDCNRAARHARGRHICLAVTDTGTGMTPEVQARIFDPFFTTKSAGRGLGLAVIGRIVGSHGGTVNVVSEFGRGSRLEILLPCIGAPAAKPGAGQAVETAGKSMSRCETILLVEDEDALRGAVARMLRRKGFSVIEAGDGVSGVDLFRARAEGIAVVLLDLTLAGKPGQEVLAELRRIRPGVPVILTTAYSREMALATVGGPQSWLYLRKPYPFSELEALLGDACQGQGEHRDLSVVDRQA